MFNSPRQTAGQPLKPDMFMILIALSPAPRHGYAIMRDVAERSDGAVVLQTGALYRTIKAMVADGLIAECPAPPGTASEDERRRYYQTTAAGDKALAAETDRLSRLVRAARLSLAGRHARLA